MTNLVALRNILKGIDLVNLDLQVTGEEQSEKLIAVPFELLAGFNVSEKRWASHFKTLG